MEITYLPHDPEVVRTIARWHQREWGHLSSRTVADRVAEFDEQIGSDRVPLTLVAWQDGRPIGTASLLVYDMEGRPELTPWLGSVYVLPEHRRQGVGQRLCERAVAEAARLGVPVLYLFTPDQAPFYARMGWETVETLEYHGERVTLMRLKPRD